MTKPKTKIENDKDPILNTIKNKIGKPANVFPIVGIGASAGGLEALEQFFENMPDENGMAFVVIQHLDPNHAGIMPELLQRITCMKVLQASNNLTIKPNTVYVIPPNKSMSVLKEVLYLFDPVESRGLRLPINMFFRSLADDRHENSIGIILSGMGSDGSQGVKAIKEKNGVVLVQEPTTAKFDSMPRNAIDTVTADIIAPAEELPGKLIALLKINPTVKKETEIDSKYRSNLEKIIILLREQTTHDFSQYKKNTLFRRIERRKGIHQIEKIQNYVHFLQENPKELDILFKELLIGVTSFFRDTAVWEMLSNKVIPELIDKLQNGYLLRAWVVGCSTGEEAYSLAIVFKEVMGKLKKHKNINLQIFATDLDQDAIEFARKGIFSKEIANYISSERISRFFTAENDGYRVSNIIREMVVFAPQNVIKDPPFTRIDVLNCRNMLIYMESELQNKILSLFNYSLNPGGIMILGTAETIDKNNTGFFEIDSHLKIFKRNLNLEHTQLIDFPSSFSYTKNRIMEQKISPKVVENIQTLTDQILLQHYAPPSVLVNDKGDIIYITGRTGKFLEPVAGKANWNIYAMAREGLRNELPPAFRKAMQDFEPHTIKNIKSGNNGNSIFVDITVQQLESPKTIKGLIIVIFREVAAVFQHDTTKPHTLSKSSNILIKDLELKLQRSYEDLQSIREEMQTSQEELKSTNEELQSTNEELQSTNEELTTSKEEMQSLNEELQTVNAELMSNVNDYIKANDDMKNLLNATEIATLFLDKNLNIRRFTDNTVNIIKLRSSDIGRPFTDLVTDLKYPEIGNHSRQVLKTLTTIETAISTNDSRWFNIRIMPYRTINDHIDGLVITFSDITIAKKLELELKKANQALKERKKDTENDEE